MRPSSCCPRGGNRCDDVARIQPGGHGFRDRVSAARCCAVRAGEPVRLGSRLRRRRGARGVRLAPLPPGDGGARASSERDEARSGVPARAAGNPPPQLVSTWVVWNSACRHHYAGAGHPERPQRFEAVLEALRRPELAALVEWVEAPPPPPPPAPLATREAIGRVHPAAYIDLLAAMDARGGGSLDADTFLGPRSWESVLASAGVAVAPVERAPGGGGRARAFAVTRPAGHHALAERAMGFCFLNHVVIAARDAQP